MSTAVTERQEQQRPTLAQMLREARARMGLTREALVVRAAVLAGGDKPVFTVNYLALLESGQKTKPGAEILRYIAMVLDPKHPRRMFLRLQAAASEIPWEWAEEDFRRANELLSA